MALSAGPWNESWYGAVSAVCYQRIASTAAGLSVQAERLGRWAVLMVRRRSTVRFRKGAPVQKQSSAQKANVVGTKVGTNGRASCNCIGGVRRRPKLPANGSGQAILKRPPEGRGPTGAGGRQADRAGGPGTGGLTLGA